jgi:hypothetical protein
MTSRERSSYPHVLLCLGYGDAHFGAGFVPDRSAMLCFQIEE